MLSYQNVKRKTVCGGEGCEGGMCGGLKQDEEKRESKKEKKKGRVEGWSCS